MGTAYTFTLRPGLRDLRGSPVGTNFKRILRTPPFALTFIPQTWASKDAPLPPNPEIQVAFNRNIHIESAASFFEFADQSGKRVPAVLNRPASYQLYFFGRDPATSDWAARWTEALHPSPSPQQTEDDPATPEDPARSLPVSSRLMVSPASPLPAGRWRLEIAAGLPDASGLHKIPSKSSHTLGLVEPFELTSVLTSSHLNSGRSVVIELSEPLDPSINDDNAHEFFLCTPQPAGLRFDVMGTSVTLQAAFDRDTVYTLASAPSLRSQSGRPLSAPQQHTLRFAPISPRVYLPDILIQQSEGGRRILPITAVNLRSLSVRAVLVAPDDVSAALQTFESYRKTFDPKDPEPDEIHSPLKADAIRGATIFEKRYPLPEAPTDTRQSIDLPWDEILGARRTGVLFVTVDGAPANGRHPGAQALVQLTDLGVSWKQHSQGLSLTLFSLRSAQSLEGARVTLLDADHRPLAHATTDAQGASLLAPKTIPSWLLAQHADDTLVLPMGPDAKDLPMAAFNLPVYYTAWQPGDEPAATELFRAALFTERPLYKPGEKVCIKGFLRKLTDHGLEPVAHFQTTLELHLPGQHGQRQIPVQTDAEGAFDTVCTLDRSIVGRHLLRFEALPGANAWEPGFSTRFEVAQYQPDAFEADLQLPAQIPPGTAMEAQFAGRYFFGAPLSEVPVKWVLQNSPAPFQPEGWSAFTFTEQRQGNERFLTLRGEERLSAKGTASVRPALPEPKGGPARSVLTVEVTDLNQQTVSATRTCLRDSSSFYLGLEIPDKVVLGHDEAIAARVVAVDPAGNPLPSPAAITVELVRVRFETVRVQGAGRGMSFQSEQRLELLESRKTSTLVPQKAPDGWHLSSEDTDATLFKPSKAGTYLLRASATDPAGRPVSSSLFLNVTGSEPVAWDYKHPAQIKLVPDKPAYQPGETAKILVQSPFTGEAKVTIEREDRILRTLRFRLAGNAPVIEIPLEKGDAPNIFVSLMLLRGTDQSPRKFKQPEFRYGLCQLHVQRPETALHVDVRPLAPRAQPGEKVATEIHVRDSAGAPAPNAAVTFFAVDDGVLAITGYQRPQPSTLFERPFPLRVRTGLSLFSLLPEDPSELPLANKGYLIGGGGSEGPLKARTDFFGTACWLPNLRTDKDGRCRAEFTAPDSLTRYRLVAVAAAGPDSFGSAESSVQIHRPLVILSGLGQGARTGDQIQARAVVRNQSGSDGALTLTLQLDPHAVCPEGSLTRNIPLADGQSAAFDFPVRLASTGDARWVWNARLEPGAGPAFSDSLETPFRIESPAPLLRETYLRDVRSKTNDLLAKVNPQMRDASGTAEVTLSNTRLATLREAARNLLAYPYGCAEQQISAMLPWILSVELAPVLPELASPQKRTRVLGDAVAKLLSQQTPSGGIAYWPGSRTSDLFVSAYAALALTRLRTSAPELLPQPAMDSLLLFLSNSLRGIGENRNPTQSLDTHALAALAIAAAGVPEPAYHEALNAAKDRLTTEGRAFLASAILLSGPTPPPRTAAGINLEKLLAPAAPTTLSPDWFTSSTREIAIRLMALCQYNPRHRDIDRLVHELITAQINGRWRTTQEDAWALLALTHYFQLVEGPPQPVDATLLHNATPSPFHLDLTTLVHKIPIALAPASPLTSLEVRNPSRSNLFAETRFVALPPLEAQPRQDRGYSVSRSYQKLAIDGTAAPASPWAVGDRVLVTVRVETLSPGHFVAIDDPLPAVLEAINPHFTSSSATPSGTRFTSASYRETRADRVLFFCDHIQAGAHLFQYVARVRTAGSVVAPGTKVEEMYRPQRFGLGESGRFDSEPAPR